MATASASLKELLQQHTMPGAAALMRPEKNGAVRCLACGHRCFIKPGKAGVCHVRFNAAQDATEGSGELRVPAGYVAGLQVDPIEKKPFFHAYPGQDALSFGMLGCDLHCGYCQNWVTSQALRDDDAIAPPRFTTPEHLVDIAQQHRVPVIVSTYNEPLITADWAVQVFEPARDAGLVCGFVSNGNATPEVLDYLKPYVTLYKVDLKSFNDKSYRQLGCTLDNVLESIQRLVDMKFWVEIVTLVIPDFNDSTEELTDIANFIASVSTDIPWHVTAFHPDYKMTTPPRTTLETLDRAYNAGKTAGLHYVYPGNLPGHVGDRENTCCPNCNTTLIKREGFQVLENKMKKNQCPNCKTTIPGIWEDNPPRQSTGNGMPRALAL